MRKINFYTLLILLFIGIRFCFGQSNYTNEISIKNINFFIYNNEKARVIQGDYKGVVIIPERIKHQGKTYTVEEIGYGAFENATELTSIELPESIKVIQGRAFENCNQIKKIQLPSSLESIQDAAFLKCTNLIELHIPKNVTSIRPFTFNHCESLTKIQVDENNEHFASLAGVLYDKNYKTLIKIPENTLSYTFPNTVTAITSDAFNNCVYLTVIDIPETVTNIPNHAFENCTGLTNMYLHANIDFIGFRAFSTCFNLEAFIVDQANKHFIAKDGLLYTYDKSELIQCPAQKKTVTLDAHTQIIKSYAFTNCNNLTEVTFPTSVKRIESPAFVQCNALRNVFIESEEPIRINDGAFSNIKNMATIWVKKETLDYYKNSNNLSVKELNYKTF